MSAILVGGPVFALLMFALGVVGYHEFLGLAARATFSDKGSVPLVGYVVIALITLAAVTQSGPAVLFAAVTIAVTAPLVARLRGSHGPRQGMNWSFTTFGSLYLGLPVFAAVSLRSWPGKIASEGLTAIDARLSWGWEVAPRGAAWILTIVLATWVGDSAAYLIGRAVGAHKLAPALSPNKTIEGAFGGLLGSVVAGAATFAGCGLGPVWQGGIVGLVIGGAGQLGDLSESLFKRQAGVKDSGVLIPGHGGILDRIDALLFAFPVGYVLASAMERLGSS